jgi:hypothetical protein
VTSEVRSQPAPRARAVSAAPVEALLARTDELARRWAIALILALPLERIGEIPLERFAREAPLLCGHVIRALSSDDELERIARRAEGAGTPPPAQRLAEMTGARDGKAAVEALEALRGVLWEALLDELRWNSFEQSVPARTVADLADRLAYVCSTALVSSLAEPPSEAEPKPAQPGAPRFGPEVISGAIAPAARPPTPAARPPAPAQRSALGNGVVIIDEAPPSLRVPVADAALRLRRAAARPSPPAGAAARRARGRALPWDTPLQRQARPRDESD